MAGGTVDAGAVDACTVVEGRVEELDREDEEVEDPVDVVAPDEVDVV